jgi:hypothetical protein
VLTEACAASRTNGLALKAIPSAAASSMSRSLAPSPIATVRLIGIEKSLAKLRRASVFAARLLSFPGSHYLQLRRIIRRLHCELTKRNLTVTIEIAHLANIGTWINV